MIQSTILGQALPVELGNTVFVMGGQRLDAFAATDGVAAWLDAVKGRLRTPVPTADERLRIALVELREVVRDALASAAAGQPPGATTTKALNATARAAPSWLELRNDRDGIRSLELRRGPPLVQLTASLAEDTIALVTGADRSRIRACPAPGCIGHFIQTDPRRLYCTELCGTRARVNRLRHRRSQN